MVSVSVGTTDTDTDTDTKPEAKILTDTDTDTSIGCSLVKGDNMFLFSRYITTFHQVSNLMAYFGQPLAGQKHI